MAELELIDDPESIEIPGSDTGFGSTPAVPRTKIPRVTADEQVEQVKPGQPFLDPQGNRRQRPYEVQSDADLASVPEGAYFIDPTGATRQKPKYEPVDFTANTLAHMAVNDKEYRKALERSYPGKVRGTTREDMYVEDDDGVLRKPKGFTEAPGSFVSGIAFPTIGATAGGIAGGIAGAPTGIGAALGGAAGAAGGGAVGQSFNDGIMVLAGIYDRSVGEQALETGISAAAGAGGELVGRGVVAALPYAKSAVKNFAAKRVGKATGAIDDPGKLAQALDISQEGEHESASWLLRRFGMTDPGTEVPIGTWAPESPYLAIVESWETAFKKQNPLAQSASRYYERKAGELLEQQGLTVPQGGVATPISATSVRDMGQAVLDRASKQAAATDERFVTEMTKRMEEVKAGVPTTLEARQATIAAFQADADAAKNLINASLKSVQSNIDDAMKIAEAGSDNGAVWQTVAEQMRAIELGVDAKAARYYGQFREAAGTNPVEIGNLPEAAVRLIAKLPENFKQQYPSIIQQTAKLAENESPTTLPDLHHLRSVFRDKANWWSLESSLKNGELKYLAMQVDAAIQAAGKEPEREMAVRLLNATDTWYHEERAIFNAQVMETIMKGIRSGEPADPSALLNVMAKEGRSDLTRKLMTMISPEMANALKATDKQLMVNNSKTLSFDGGLDAAKFADQVLDRYQSGMLHTLHGEKGGDELFRIAQQIHAFKGKIDIPSKPGDTALDILARGRMAQEAIVAEGKKDPLRVLSSEMEAVAKEQQAKLAQAQALRRQSPLHFLFNPRIGAVEAATRILGSEDLIMATEIQFGRNSPEFRMIQQSAMEKILHGTINPSEGLGKLSPEAKELLFPGAVEGFLEKLASNMSFLTKTSGDIDSVAMGMAAMGKVTHPWASILGKGGKVAKTLTAPTKWLPGMDYLGRSILSDYYGFIRKFLGSPSFQRYVMKGLDGDEPARLQTRAQIQRLMQKGGAMGSGIGESQEKTIEENYQVPRITVNPDYSRTQ